MKTIDLKFDLRKINIFQKSLNSISKNELDTRNFFFHETIQAFIFGVFFYLGLVLWIGK